MTCSDTYAPGSTAAARYLPETGGLARLFNSIHGTVKLWHQRRQGREALRDMPEHLLRDVGLNVATARYEANKPFWQA